MSEDKPRLLIVEDDPGLQKQLKWCFDSYEVLQAGSRSEAIALMRRFEPPVVLQDLGLPPDADGVSEGMATLQELLQLEPRAKIIVVTGRADRDSAVQGGRRRRLGLLFQAGRHRRAQAHRATRLPHRGSGSGKPATAPGRR